MNLSPKHQSELNTGLFALTEARLLFRGERGAGTSAEALRSQSSDSEPAHYVPESEVDRAVREAREAKKSNEMELLDTIDAYNAHYGKEVKDKQPNTHYQSIDIDFDDLGGTKKQMMAIREEIRKLKSSQADLVNDTQYQTLVNLILIVEKTEKLPDQGHDALLRAHRARLARRHEVMNQAGERKELWDKKPAYKKLSGVFEDLAGSQEFRGVWAAPDGLASQHQREAKELFLAILADKTNGFESSFVLGDNFGNEPEENIRNFPFIYHEFLKHEGDKIAGEKVSAEAIDQAAISASEATRKLESIDSAELIIGNNHTAGINPSDLGTRPSMPDSAGWTKRKEVLENMRRILLRESAKAEEPQKSGWQKASLDLKLHEEEAEVYLKLSRLKDREKLVQDRFTRKELSDPSDPIRQKLVMSLAMKQFMKAMEQVDRPHKGTNWLNTLHPTVRRLLIASTYENGVATYERDEQGVLRYDESTNKNRTWMLSNLALSNYFNMKEEGENMDASHNAILKAAYLSSRIAVLLEETKDIGNLLDAISRGALAEEYTAYPPKYVEAYSKYTAAEARSTKANLDTDRARLQIFLNRTEAAIRNPYSEDSKRFIADIQNNTYAAEISPEIDRLGKLGIIDGARLAEYEKQMHSLQINFKTAELQEMNSLMFFEGMGLHIEGVYTKYLDMIKENPGLKAEYWHNLLLGNDDGFKQLMDFLTIILPDSDAGGKQDFLASMVLLRNKYKGKAELPASTFADGDQDAVTLSVFQMLKLHLTGRSETAAASDMKAKEIEAKKNGMHLGDLASVHIEGVWDMLTGPGQSIANRAAGFALLYGAYKAARSAMKGDTTHGKVLRALFVATAVEIGVKNLTGRGVLDRLGMDMLEDASEGTYEAVLIQDARAEMDNKEITKEAHETALFSLNDVPFHEVMNWYDNSDPNGMPLNPKGQDPLPGGLRAKLGDIARMQGSSIQLVDKEMIARRVLYETVRHFFGYVSKKENSIGHDRVKESLRERWVSMVDNPDMETNESNYHHRDWLKERGIQKRDITWKMVMRSEIDDSEVQATIGQTLAGRLEAGVREGAETTMEWLTEHVYYPGSGHAEKLLESMGEGAQDAKKFFADAYEWSGQKLYFGKESVVLWYGEHQFEIKRTAENHWQLLVTSIKLPFKIIYGVDNWAIPWTLSKLKQIEQILESSKVETSDHALNATDIASNPNFLGSMNTEANPEFSQFGLTQVSFMDALSNGTDFSESPTHIGHYISRTTPQEAGVNESDSLDNTWSKMAIHARKEAEKRFVDTGKLKPEDVERFMYPIHTIKKTTDPKELYIFWRMPLRGSAELDLLATGNLADFNDPNRRKDREHFEVDPSQTSWENLKDAFALNMGPARVFTSEVGAYAAQVPAFIYWNAKQAGGMVKAVAHVFIRGQNEAAREREFDEAINAISERSPEHQQFIDEVFTSAGDKDLAISDYYKEPVNAKLYRFVLDFAQHKGDTLYLGIMEGRDRYVGKMYLDHPNKREYYTELTAYYNAYYGAVPPLKPRDNDIEAAIVAAVAKL